MSTTVEFAFVMIPLPSSRFGTQPCLLGLDPGSLEAAQLGLAQRWTAMHFTRRAANGPVGNISASRGKKIFHLGAARALRVLRDDQR